jgi:hypothetical protein
MDSRMNLVLPLSSNALRARDGSLFQRLRALLSPHLADATGRLRPLVLTDLGRIGSSCKRDVIGPSPLGRERYRRRGTDARPLSQRFRPVGEILGCRLLERTPTNLTLLDHGPLDTLGWCESNPGAAPLA